MSMSDHVHSKNFYPGSEVERKTSSQSVFNLPEIIEDIQTSANDPTHEGRTRVLIDSPDHVTIVSGYQPGEGEALHAHPTRNTLLFLAGTFDLWLISAEGQEVRHETYPGMMAAMVGGLLLSLSGFPYSQPLPTDTLPFSHVQLAEPSPCPPF